MAELSAAARRHRIEILIERANDMALPVSLTDTGERLDALGRLIDRTDDPSELDSLTRAYERLFKVWQVLTRTPNPGQLRPLPERSLPPARRAIIDAESLPSTAEAQTVPAPLPPAPPADPALAVKGGPILPDPRT